MILPAMRTGLKGFLRAANNWAVKDKSFAEELVFVHGIRGQINAQNMKGITKDIFDATGHISAIGVNEVTRCLNELNLQPNATWETIFSSIRKLKNSINYLNNYTKANIFNEEYLYYILSSLAFEQTGIDIRIPHK